MSRKVRPYLFYDTTNSVCTTCLCKVEAKVDHQGRAASYLEKWCPAHGTQRVLIADDAEYYRSCREVFVKPPEMPRALQYTRCSSGCPYDCGLCPDHMQHSCLTLVEITDNCNLRCPICYAGSGPHASCTSRSTDVERMLDAVVANEGEPDVVQISRWRADAAPGLFAILDAARARPIRHLMINTNGIRIAQEREFAAAAGALHARDSRCTCSSIRFGRRRCASCAARICATSARRRLTHLNEFGISTTLVVTSRKA